MCKGSVRVVVGAKLNLTGSRFHFPHALLLLVVYSIGVKGEGQGNGRVAVVRDEAQRRDAEGAENRRECKTEMLVEAAFRFSETSTVGAGENPAMRNIPKRLRLR